MAIPINGKMLRSSPGILVDSLGDILHPLGSIEYIEGFLHRAGAPCSLATSSSSLSVSCGGYADNATLSGMAYAVGVISGDMVVQYHDGVWVPIISGEGFAVSNSSLNISKYVPRHHYMMASYNSEEDVKRVTLVTRYIYPCCNLHTYDNFKICVEQEYLLAENDPVQGAIIIKKTRERELTAVEEALQELVLSFEREQRSHKVRMRKVFPKKFVFNRDYEEESVQRNEKDAIIILSATLYEYFHKLTQRQRTYKALATIGLSAVQSAQRYISLYDARYNEYLETRHLYDLAVQNATNACARVIDNVISQSYQVYT